VIDRFPVSGGRTTEAVTDVPHGELVGKSGSGWLDLMLQSVASVTVAFRVMDPPPL
jgi:hypothetical protein